ncbi:MAG: sugar ABC transporter substrate-binding protein [Firmicutes bacterium HGW-Firmicutes-6]|nr:MAG: sugar ABC transporter substrate-binding protein [Firmicutes bacterium HGW-Firmicutes-6]
MKSLKKISVVFLVVALILAMVGCGGSGIKTGGAIPPRVGILQYVQHAALDSALEGFKIALSDNGYISGQTIIFLEQNAQGDTNNCSTIADQFVSDNVDLVLAIATPAAQAMAGKTSEIPILGTAVTDYVVANLVDSNQAPGGNVSGTSDMNPIKEQIDLLVKLAPATKTVGVLYTSSEDNSVLQAGIAKDAIEALGLEYVEVTVNNSNDVQQAVQSIVTQCDAIYIPTDNTFASAMPLVYGVTVESKTPVIVGEKGQVENGGLATLGINYYDLGYQTGLMAVEILQNGADISSMAVQTASDFDYCINGTVAQEIGIEIPADLQEYVITME